MIRTFSKRFSTLLPNSQSPITPRPHFFNAVSTDGKQLPTFRIIDGVGDVIQGAELPEVRSSLVVTHSIKCLSHCQINQELALKMSVSIPS